MITILKFLFVALCIAISSCATDPWSESAFQSQRAEAREQNDYLPWVEAEPLISKRCGSVLGVYQGHSRVVGVSFEDGASITTIPPEIDQILGVVDRCRADNDRVVIIME